MRFSTFGLLILLLSCESNRGNNKIMIPRLSQDYYAQSVAAMEDRILANPNDVRSIRLQLAYYEKLGWPPEAGDALERATEQLSNDPHLIDQRIAYYRSNQKDHELLNMVRELETLGQFPLQVKKYKVDIAIERGDLTSAKQDLGEIVGLGNGDDLPFVTLKYLEIGDTVNAVELVDKIEEDRDLTRDQLITFQRLLRQQGNHRRSIAMTIHYLMFNPDEEINRLLAETYYEAGDPAKAKALLMTDPDRSDKRLLATLYEQEGVLDSARYFLTSIVNESPDDRQALLALGDMEQRIGYFSRSLAYYEKILEIDSTDQNALDQIALVNRKIAYLQKIREAKKEIPTLDLSSKKENN